MKRCKIETRKSAGPPAPPSRLSFCLHSLPLSDSPILPTPYICLGAPAPVPTCTTSPLSAPPARCPPSPLPHGLSGSPLPSRLPLRLPGLPRQAVDRPAGLYVNPLVPDGVGRRGRAAACPKPGQGGQPAPEGSRAQRLLLPASLQGTSGPGGSKHLVRVPRRPGRKWDQLIHIFLSRLEYKWEDRRINLFKNVIS